MSAFFVGLIIGLFAGSAIGTGIMAICAAGKKGENNADKNV